MKLSECKSLSQSKIMGNQNAEIAGLAFDTRKIEQGFIFVAIKGTKLNGEDFISEAIQKGAVAVVIDEKSHLPKEETIFIPVKNTRETLAHLAKEFFPNRPRVLTSVTGTNGKTSIAEFTRQFFEMLGVSSASLGTMGLKSEKLTVEGNLTTPDPITFYQTFEKLFQNKIESVCFEASSNGLDQQRIGGLEKQILSAGFTNLTEDHLEYHGSMQNYFEAKKKLFTEFLSEEGVPVINADDRYGKTLISQLKSPFLFTYGKEGKHFQILKNTPTEEGQNLTLGIFGRPLKIKFPLMGEFQLYNALCALGMMFGGYYGKKVFEEGFWQPYRYAQVRLFLQSLKPIRGRLEFVKKTASGATCFVDYAHTSDGLETVLKTLRPHTTGKLTVVFGIGGARHERANMGKTAETFADKIFLTDDNPRDDDPEMLRSLIKQNIKDRSKLIEIGDRKKAIETAVKESQEGDIILVAGKGHETYQEIKGVKHRFDDREIILKTKS